MKKNYLISAILLTLFVLLSGCTSRGAITSSAVTARSLSRESYRVTLNFYTDTPFTQESPTTHLGYAGVQSADLLWTAKHLLEGDISRLVIKNAEGIICPIQHIWLHPTQDVALIKTSKPCVLGAEKNILTTNELPYALIYLDGTLKKSPIRNMGDSFFLSQKLTHGMSGSPLFLADRTIAGIVSAQTTSGTEFVALTSQLIANWPEAKKSLSLHQEN